VIQYDSLIDEQIKSGRKGKVSARSKIVLKAVFLDLKSHLELSLEIHLQHKTVYKQFENSTETKSLDFKLNIELILRPLEE
jgi:hypothetical protein